MNNGLTERALGRERRLEMARIRGHRWPVPHLVFSFGSNLLDEQLLSRCPDAILTGPAELPGYALSFVGYSARWQGGVATIRRNRRSTVLGELAVLTDADLARLDRFEGVPGVYERMQVRVRTRSRSGALEEVTAWTYHRDGAERLPSVEYVTSIARGYRRLGYDMRPLRRAVSRTMKLTMDEFIQSRMS